MDRFDVIIVMGAAVWEGHRPSPALRRRLLHGVSLWKQGAADYLLVTGGLGKYPPAEARVMKTLATEEGVPPEKILSEDQSTSTFESGIHCAKIMQVRGWSTAVIVTDDITCRGPCWFSGPGGLPPKAAPPIPVETREHPETDGFPWRGRSSRTSGIKCESRLKNYQNGFSRSFLLCRRRSPYLRHRSGRAPAPPPERRPRVRRMHHPLFYPFHSCP